jgi:hypothetical protein
MRELFHTKRSSTSHEVIPLPWLDADLAILIAVNRVPGDDLGIALDLRSGTTDPRVVASEWNNDPPCVCIWKEVAPAFSDFARLLGIQSRR